MIPMQTILRVDSSARKTGSASRALTDKLLEALFPEVSDKQIITRDLADGIGMYTEAWVEGTFTPVDARTEQHQYALSESDIIVEELKRADILILGAPMYNFNIGASLKAWIDMIARAGVTFRYTEDGPIGLVTGVKTYIVFASGGSPLGSDLDFGTKYLKHFLAFIGITDVTIVASEDDIKTAQLDLTQAA